MIWGNGSTGGASPPKVDTVKLNFRLKLDNVQRRQKMRKKMKNLWMHHHSPPAKGIVRGATITGAALIGHEDTLGQRLPKPPKAHTNPTQAGTALRWNNLFYARPGPHSGTLLTKGTTAGRNLLS